MVDLFRRAIPGWSVAETRHATLATLATDVLQRATTRGQIVPGALFHSDRGSQRSAAPTRAGLARCGLRRSLSAKGYCYDPACAESGFASLQSEGRVDGHPFASKAAARPALFACLTCFCNRKRLHRRPGWLAPQNFLNLSFHNQKTRLN